MFSFHLHNIYLTLYDHEQTNGQDFSVFGSNLNGFSGQVKVLLENRNPESALLDSLESGRRKSHGGFLQFSFPVTMNAVTHFIPLEALRV